MAKTKEEIVSDIKSYIKKFGGGYSDWYVGIAFRSETELFKDHNVDESGGSGWIIAGVRIRYCRVRLKSISSTLLGTKGGKGGGDDTTDKVYAYKITSSTVE